MGSGIVRQTGEAATYKGETLPAKRLAGAHSLVDGQPVQDQSRQMWEYRHRVIPRVWNWAFNHTAVIRRERQRQVVSYMVQSPDPIAQRSLRIRFSVEHGDASRLLVATSVFFCCVCVCVYVLYSTYSLLVVNFAPDLRPILHVHLKHRGQGEEKLIETRRGN